jgi:hypothetical protein
MTAKPVRFVCALALGLAAGSGVHAQETGKSRDAALDSLLEKLGDRDGATTSPSKKATKPAEQAKAKPQTDRSGSGDATKAAPDSKAPAGSSGQTSPAQKGKAAPKAPGSGAVAPKDQAIDDLLGKLGESKDEPAEDDRPRSPGGGANEPPKEQTPRTKSAAPAKLGAKDKEIDDRLEEIAGRRRKRPNAREDERSGPVGEMIKEMRDVEQRLGKPDSGEDTQNKQKQIIKHIDKMIEEVRQSGSQGGRLTIRMRRQQGNQPGRQEGDQPGALAQGARLMKPQKPTSQHSTSGGQGAWGHLPPELREVMENSFKETELSSKKEMIDRYFLSVAKGKPIREE